MRIRGTTQIFNPPTSPIILTDGDTEELISIPGPAGLTGPQGPAGPSGSGGASGGLMPVNDEHYEPLVVLSSNLAYIDKVNNFSLGLYERARTTAAGIWTSVAYNSANFTASGSMTWTVDSGDQVAYAYMMIGKTMFISFTFNNTSVGGTVSTELRFAIPAGFLALNNATISAIRSFDSGTDTVGFCGTVAGAGYIRCWRGGFTNWALSTNNTSVQGLAIFEVQ